MFSPRFFIHRHAWILFPLAFSLTYYWKIGESSFWYDELQTWYPLSLAKFSFFWNEYRVRETAPPFYYVLNYWIHLFTPVSETSLRMLSAVAMTACNVTVFFWTRRWFGWTVAIMAVLLISTNGYMIGFAQMARSYGLFTFAATAAFLFALKIATTGFDKKSSTNLSIALVACLMTHYYGVVVLGAIAIWLLSMVPNKKEWLPKFAAVLFFPFLIFCYLVFTQRLVSHLTFVRIPDWKILGELGEFLFRDLVQVAVLNFGLMLALARLVARRSRPWDRILGHIFFYNFLVLFLILIICMVKPVYAPRYIIFLVPTHALFLALLLVTAFEDIWFFLKNSNTRNLAVKLSTLGFAVLFAASQLWLRRVEPNHYTPVAYYPLRQALEATIQFHRSSAHSQEQIEFIVEEYSPESVRLYFPKMGLDDLGILVPEDSIEKKRKDFASFLPNADATIVYLVKVYSPGRNQDYNEIQIPGWRPLRIFVQDRISVYGFEKQSTL